MSALCLAHLTDAEFRKAWMPSFCRSGPPVVSADQFLDFVGHLLPQEPYLDLPRVTGLRDGTSRKLLGLKKSTAGGLDGWAWNEFKALPYLGMLVWLFFWNCLKPLVSGLKVFLMHILP